MKQLLIIISMAISLSATAQDKHPLEVAFDTAIIIDLPEKMGLQRKAEFMGFWYNLETQELSLRWRVRYYNDSIPISIGNVSYEDKLQTATNNAYVNLYGQTVDTVGIKQPFMTEFAFYKMIAQKGTGAKNMTINELIFQAGLRPGRWKD